jgi:AraC-like DNA-binding protein
VKVVRHESELSAWEVVSRPPPDALRPYLDRPLEGWAQTRGGGGGQMREVPFPGVPLILNLGPAWTVEDPGAGGPHRRDSFVAGLHDRPTLVHGESTSSCLELRLTPLGARRVLGLPMSELTNLTVDVGDLWRDAPELGERLREATSWEARFDLVDMFLLRRIGDSSPTQPGVAWAWRRLLETGGRRAVGDLADELGWSPRRFIVRFREQVGLTPKTAARVIRFDHTVSRLRRADESLAEIAYACGYFDQAHLNREFRELAGTTPRLFRSAMLPSAGVAA